MAATQTPTPPPTQRRNQLPTRTPIASRILSPSAPLPSNDDCLERATVRRKSAAARRRSGEVIEDGRGGGGGGGGEGNGNRKGVLDEERISELFYNCIRLARENKINQKNTWELDLIDHLSEIIRCRPEDDVETNFQKASCTLEAGVKIYAMRVDSVHSAAYKVLGGITRAARGEYTETAEGDHANSTQSVGLSKKELEKKLSPLATLESSFEALNVKKFDVAFTVDPLYHQTSAQFDEGGAKGLLLNNLGVYGLCCVLFDSYESPESIMLRGKQKNTSEVVDLSFAKDCIETMVTNMPEANDISPTLREIVKLLDEDNCRLSAAGISKEIPTVQDDVLDNKQMGLPGSTFADDYGFDHDDQSGIADGVCTGTFNDLSSHQEESFGYMFDSPGTYEKPNSFYDFSSLGLGFISKPNAWAGPDHWKYKKKTKGLDQPSTSARESEATTKKRRHKREAPDIDFRKSINTEISDIFAPPKNPNSLLLPVNKVVHNIYLPEDCHYRPESLISLFMLPNVMCLAKRVGRFSNDSDRVNDRFDPLQSRDNESVADDHFDDECTFSDAEDPGTLVPDPRQVKKVEIQYDKVSKQIDVHALKDTFWVRIQESVQCSDKPCDATVSLKQALQKFWDESPVHSARDISPHLLFICLLHLANEKSLSLQSHPSLDELDVHIPSSAFVE